MSKCTTLTVFNTPSSETIHVPPTPSVCEKKLRFLSLALEVFPELDSVSSITSPPSVLFHSPYASAKQDYTLDTLWLSLFPAFCTHCFLYFFLTVGYLHSTMLQGLISSAIWSFPLLQIISANSELPYFYSSQALSFQFNQNLLITHHVWDTLPDTRNTSTHTHEYISCPQETNNINGK